MLCHLIFAARREEVEEEVEQEVWIGSQAQKTSRFSSVGINKLQDCDESVYFPNHDYHENRKNTLYHLSEQWLITRKMLHQKHEYNIYVLPLKNCVNWISSRQEKMLLPQKRTFS